MSVDPRLLVRHLRQQAQLGGRELYLDDVSPAELEAALRARPAIAKPSAVRERQPESRVEPQPKAGLERQPEAQPAHQPRPGEAGDPAALVQLGRAASGCQLCRLSETRTNVVFGEGDPAADVVVVGEAPGQEEDRTGRPFVGRAGKLLDLMLMSIGLPRSSVYICNVLKCRPPQNRNPAPDEVDLCTTHYLHGQLEAIAPRVLLAVGKFSAQVLCASDASIGRLRGRVHAYRGTPVVVTYHPAYLLRSSANVRIAWQDFQLVRRVLHEQA